MQPPLGVDMDLRPCNEPVRQRSPGAVELAGVLGEQLARVVGHAERVERRPAKLSCPETL
jgi:hypothetical protein